MLGKMHRETGISEWTRKEAERDRERAERTGERETECTLDGIDKRSGEGREARR